MSGKTFAQGGLHIWYSWNETSPHIDDKPRMSDKTKHYWRMSCPISIMSARTRTRSLLASLTKLTGLLVVSSSLAWILLVQLYPLRLKSWSNRSKGGGIVQHHTLIPWEGFKVRSLNGYMLHSSHHYNYLCLYTWYTIYRVANPSISQIGWSLSKKIF